MVMRSVVAVRAVVAAVVRAIAAMSVRFDAANRYFKAPKGRHVIAQGSALGKVPCVGVFFIPLFRPFRAGDIFDHRTQGVALGYHIWPRWGLARSDWCIACRDVEAVFVRGGVRARRCPCAAVSVRA